MPGRLDGLSLASIARESHPGLPVVFITGRPDSAMRAQEVGEPTEIVEKPFNISHLLVTVQRPVGVASRLGGTAVASQAPDAD
jgi:FixJ family two-component response regulator